MIMIAPDTINKLISAQNIQTRRSTRIRLAGAFAVFDYLCSLVTVRERLRVGIQEHCSVRIVLGAVQCYVLLTL